MIAGEIDWQITVHVARIGRTQGYQALCRGKVPEHCRVVKWCVLIFTLLVYVGAACNQDANGLCITPLCTHVERSLTVEPLRRNGVDVRAKEDVGFSDPSKDLSERFHAA
jgi:hypothetical protein